MNPLTFAMVALRGLATLFGLQGNAPAAAALNKLASAIELGRLKNVDDHLKLVAAALESGQPNDWDGVVSRIEADAARLQAP